jgi:membrane protease YdiL (CAAX protease family)
MFRVARAAAAFSAAAALLLGGRGSAGEPGPSEWPRAAKKVLALLKEKKDDEAREALLEYASRGDPAAATTRQVLGADWASAFCVFWPGKLVDATGEDLSRLEKFCSQHAAYTVPREVLLALRGRKGARPGLERMGAAGELTWWGWYLIGELREDGRGESGGGYPDSCVEAYKRSAELSPSFAMAWDKLIEAYAARGEDDALASALEARLSLPFSRPRRKRSCQLRYAKLLLDKGDLAGGFKVLREADALVPVLVVTALLFVVPILLLGAVIGLVLYFARRRRRAGAQGQEGAEVEHPPERHPEIRFRWYHGLVILGLFCLLQVAASAAVMVVTGGASLVALLVATAVAGSLLSVIVAGWGRRLYGSARGALGLMVWPRPREWLWVLAAAAAMVGCGYAYDALLGLFGAKLEQKLALGLARLSGFGNWVLAGLAVGLVIPVAEEVVFRGCLFPGLKKSLGLWPGLLLSAALFAFAHLELVAFPPLFVMGLLAALLYERTKTLAAPVVLHALSNTTSVMLLLLFS